MAKIKTVDEVIQSVVNLLAAKKAERDILKKELDAIITKEQADLITKIKQVNFEVRSLTLMVNSTYGAKGC